jgi:ABC-type dipeptide/oligopeptide/nickel transport system permease subunit
MADPALFDNELTAATSGIGGPEAGISDVITAPTSRAEIWRRFRKNKLAVAGLAFIVLVIVSALAAPLITKYGPYDRPTPLQFKSPPSRTHWFGTDIIGHDQFSRVLYGARIALRIGFAASAIAIAIGVVLGLFAGFFGGWVDNTLMRITDVFLAIPYIVLAAAIAVVFGRSQNSIIIILGITGWLAIARIVRATVLQLKQLEYVEAANALGYTRRRVMWRHIMPNALQPIIVYGTIEIGGVILSAAALSFLGIGEKPGTPDWGQMIADNKGEIGSAAHLVFFPGVAIFLTVLAFVFIGDGLRDALDPRLRGRE